MSLYYLILWNQMDILQKHFKKDHVHILWMRLYGTVYTIYLAYRYFRNFGLGGEIREGLISQFF